MGSIGIRLEYAIDELRKEMPFNRKLSLLMPGLEVLVEEVKEMEQESAGDRPPPVYHPGYPA